MGQTTIGALSSSDWSLLGSSLAAVLFLTPGVLLILRHVRGTRLPWWLLVGLSLAIGWACTIGASFATTQGLSVEIEEYESRQEPVPDQLMEDWASDAHQVFALLFGWAFASIILSAWLVVYTIAVGIQKAFQACASASSDKSANKIEHNRDDRNSAVDCNRPRP